MKPKGEAIYFLDHMEGKTIRKVKDLYNYGTDAVYIEFTDGDYGFLHTEDNMVDLIHVDFLRLESVPKGVTIQKLIGWITQQELDVLLQDHIRNTIPREVSIIKGSSNDIISL